MEIKKVLEVARLDVKDEAKLAKEVQNILKAFKKISEVNTQNVSKSLHPLKIEGSLRDDEIKEGLRREEALSLVKNKNKEYFLGPRLK